MAHAMLAAIPAWITILLLSEIRKSVAGAQTMERERCDTQWFAQHYTMDGIIKELDKRLEDAMAYRPRIGDLYDAKERALQEMAIHGEHNSTMEEVAKARTNVNATAAATKGDGLQGTHTSEMMRWEHNGEVTAYTKRKRERDPFERAALKWQGGHATMESDNDGRKEDQRMHRDMPSKTKRKESDNDTIIFAWENKRSRDANAERRENAGLESKAEVDHFKDESEQNRDTCNDGTPSTDYNRGESSRAKSHVRMEFSRGKPRERIPNGHIAWTESGDYARSAQREIGRTQQNQDNLCHMRNQTIIAVMEQEESHRSHWTIGSRLNQSKDRSQSWKGKPWIKPPQFFEVAVHANGLPNHASVMEYVALFNTFTNGFIFVRHKRQDDGSLQGARITQYKPMEQADAIPDAIVPSAKLRMQGKTVLSNRYRFEYLTGMNQVTDDAQYYLSDPMERPINMFPEQRNTTDYWFTGKWVTEGHDDQYNNGQARDICRMRFRTKPLEWAVDYEAYLAPEEYRRTCPALMEHIANGEVEPEKRTTCTERQ